MPAKDLARFLGAQAPATTKGIAITLFLDVYSTNRRYHKFHSQRQIYLYGHHCVPSRCYLHNKLRAIDLEIALCENYSFSVCKVSIS